MSVSLSYADLIVEFSTPIFLVEEGDCFDVTVRLTIPGNGNDESAGVPVSANVSSGSGKSGAGKSSEQL